MQRQYLAFDLGASNGRAIVGTLEDGRITLEELHRFPNAPVAINGGLFWNVLGLFTELKTGLSKAVQKGIALSGIGIDTWGVDYAFLDKQGFLVGNPRNYRDPRVDDVLPWTFERVSKEEIYRATGIQIMPLNTIFQLSAAVRDGDCQLAAAEKLLFIPNLLTWLFTGNVSAEYTFATTSQLYDPFAKDWSWKLIDAIGVKRSLFPKIVPPGTVAGPLLPQVRAETKCGAEVPVILVGSHDTASAVAAVPAEKGADWAYLSSGTWSLLGMELDAPLVTAESFAANYTNEGGVCGTIRFLKNIMGLWLIQECRNEWNRHGANLGFGEIMRQAEEAEPFQSFVDPNDPLFVAPGDMPGRIAEFCRRTGQRVPEGVGAIARCAFESLALRYRKAIEELEKLTGRKVDVLHIVGGGCKNTLLNQFTADASGRLVKTGPVEGTALGNIVMQALATGAVGDLQEAREIIAASSEMETYRPQNPGAWDAAFQRCKGILR
jgi:rhamnulokinase